ncbi:hypothetical protein HY771_00515 [Candidatus Uhrbacteria bacterium]|nr:hypothetical protein [Candidatus Uhrbacteria bacterium]
MDINVLQCRLDAGEEDAKRKLKEMHGLLEQLHKQIKTAQAKPAEPPPQTPPPPAQQPAPSGTSLPAFVGDMQFGMVDAPGQFAATTWNVPGIDLLWIKNLHGGIDRFLDGAQQVRIVVRKNGVVVPVAHQGEFSFLEFYADLNNDGKPDARPYKGVDPSAVDDIFVSDVRPSDQVELIYLVRTRKLVTISNLPPQILWGSPTRAKMDPTRFVGRRVMSASTAMVIR